MLLATQAAWLVMAASGGLATVLSLYLVTLALASRSPKVPPPTHSPKPRLAVVVPAHDEATLIGRCVASLVAQDYPRDRFRVVVVADNCTDDTAALAKRAGADEVLVRQAPHARGKGQALAWAFRRLLKGRLPPDAVVVVDADSVAEPSLLSDLGDCYRAGVGAAQADYRVLPGNGSWRERLAGVGFLLFHRVRLAGRARLGLPANLVGNGMLLAREVLERCPWDAFTAAEDLEYTVRLRLLGVRPAFAPTARIWGPVPVTATSARAQRLRWEGGRFHLIRHLLPKLLVACARGPVRPWDMALDLAVPPIGMLAAACTAGVLLCLAGSAPLWASLPWLVAATGIPAFVGVGLVAAKAPASAWLALAAAPIFLADKALTYLGLARGFDPTLWVRSERGGNERRVQVFDVFGVPIHVVRMQDALRHLASALDGDTLLHVATVNLDFVVGAHRHTDVRRILRSTGLNVPDGAPVVWLGRLLGHHVIERVAGADLVPKLMEIAAQRRARVFLLGGECGAAALAAERIHRDYPGVEVVGHFEPPRAAIDDMGNEAILSLLQQAQPDILLVALGHPKQERWIAQHREHLPVRIAIGVGCVFDLLAGRTRRAPVWMRRGGLEWLYRALHEPRRLGRRYASNLTWLARLTTLALLQRLG